MAICSHPLATHEAVEILRRGGNTCDAALCAAITQTVVEPHMTGITGILSMLIMMPPPGIRLMSTAI